MPLDGALASDIQERPVRLESNPAPLHGTLTLPGAFKGAILGVLIVAGSGPVDRDGNLPGLRNDSLKGLAHGLAQRGIATLRIDKRGVGLSAPAMTSEADLRFSTYVDDAVGWLDRLRAESGIGRIGLVGHSEGGLVAVLASQKRRDIAGLVLLGMSGRSMGALLRAQFAAGAVPPALLTTANEVLAQLEQGRSVPDVPAALTPLFRPSVQPYFMSRLGIDPVAELARTPAPALVIQGTTDLHVAEADARLLGGARAGVDLTIVEGMNHIFKAAPRDRQPNLATYAGPTIPIMPAVVDRIAAFLNAAP